MRVDRVWKDICIRNISSRGMLIQAACPPLKGIYLEIYRGRHVIVARVAWSKGHRFGVQSQDRLDFDALIREPDVSEVNHESRLKGEPTFQRRAVSRRPSQPDLKWEAELSKFTSRAFEFACLGAIGGALGLVIFEMTSKVLTGPLVAVTAQLSN